MKVQKYIVRTAVAVLFIIGLIYLYQTNKQCKAAFGADSIYCVD